MTMTVELARMLLNEKVQGFMGQWIRQQLHLMLFGFYPIQIRGLLTDIPAFQIWRISHTGIYFLNERINYENTICNSDIISAIKNYDRNLDRNNNRSHPACYRDFNLEYLDQAEKLTCRLAEIERNTRSV